MTRLRHYLRAALDQIEAAQRDAAEARAIAANTEARLDAIEGYLRARRVAKFRRVADELALVIWADQLVRKEGRS